jgi:hypothetical protein
MRPIDYGVCLIMAIVMIIGGYQFYFFVQRNHIRKPREFDTRYDDMIPFWPSWVWIYSGLYYPAILVLVFLQASYENFSKTAFSFLVLLAMQFTVFFLFPVKIPERWRNYDHKASLSLRMLAFVHLQVALAPVFGADASWIFLFPVLIALSAIFTKQHYLYDLLPGAFFGWLAWRLTAQILS